MLGQSDFLLSPRNQGGQPPPPFLPPTGPPPVRKEEEPAVDTGRPTTGSLAPAWKKPPDWKEFIPEGERSGRKDIIVNKLVQAGAPAETIAEYVNKNADAVTVGSVNALRGVNQALATGKAEVKLGNKEPVKIETVNKPGTVNIDGKAVTGQQIAIINSIRSQRSLESYSDRLGIKVPNDKALSEAIQKQSPYLYQVYREQGYDAYRKAIDYQNKAIDDLNKRIEEKNERLNAANKRQFDKVVNTLTPELQAFVNKTYKTDQKAAIQAVNDYIKGIRIQRQTQYQKEVIKREAFQQYIDHERSALLGSLSKYADSAGNYDLARYLRDNPNGETKLQDVFKPEDIKGAVEYNRESFGIGLSSWVPQGEFVTAYFDKKGWNTPAAAKRHFKNRELLDKRLDEANKAYLREHPQPSVDFETYLKQRRDDAGLGGPRTFANAAKQTAFRNKVYDEYNRIYGPNAAFSSQLGDVAQYVFVPARAIKPNVELKDITALEWAIGAAQIATLALPAARGALGAAISAGAGGVFVYDTVKNWGVMSPGQRTLSVILDTLVLSPFIAAGSRAIKTAFQGTGMKAAELIKAEAAANQALANQLNKSFGASVGKAFDDFAKAQQRYAELKANELAPRDITVRGKNIGTTAPNPEAIAAARQELEAAARRYVESLKGKAGFDSADVKEIINRMEKDIVANVDDSIRNTIPKKETIAKLKRELDAANKRLKQAQEKHPSSPDKWANELFEQVKAQVEYETATRNQLSSLTAELNRVRNAIRKYERSVKNNINRRQLRVLANRERQLVRDIDSYVKRMEVEWGKGGAKSSGGRLAVDVQRPVKPFSPSELRRIGAKAEGGVVGSLVRGGAAAASRRGTKPAAPAVAPSVRPVKSIEPVLTEIQDISELVRREVKRQHKPIDESGIAAIAKTAYGQGISTDTNTQAWKTIKELVETYNKQDTRQERAERTGTRVDESQRAESKPETKPEARTKVEPDTKVSTKTKPEARTGKTSNRPVIPLTGGKKSAEWDEEDIASAIAWKSGVVVHAIRSPYRRGIDEKSFSADRVPPGLKVNTQQKGKGSAGRSVRVQGTPPKRVTVDMGIQDVVISRVKPGRVKLAFKPDRNSRTRSDLTVKHRSTSISKKIGAIYHTRMGKTNVLSRRPLRGRR